MRTNRRAIAAVVALCGALVAWPAAADIIYDSTPPVPGLPSLPPNVDSISYQGTETAEVGDLISFDGTARSLTTVTAVMSSWAISPDSSTSFQHDITFNLYTDTGGGVPSATPFATQTVTVTVPYRPAQDGACAPVDGVSGYSPPDCYNGLAFAVTFDFTGTTVPNQIIYGVAFNTEDFGYVPEGSPGPYNSLNFGLASGPSVGGTPSPGTIYMFTTPDNVFQQYLITDLFGDIDSFVGNVRFEAVERVPEPASLLLLAIGLVGLGFFARRRGSQAVAA